MATAKANFEAAKNQALLVLEENFIDEPPVSPLEIVNNYGINKVVFADFGESNSNVSGFLNVNEKKIYVNTKDSLNRQTFTIAHEFGHWLLHRELIERDPEKYKVLYRIPLGKADIDPLEKEANCFAANLLVPQKMLDKYKATCTLDELAQLFAVSRDVIAFRLKMAS